MNVFIDIVKGYCFISFLSFKKSYFHIGQLKLKLNNFIYDLILICTQYNLDRYLIKIKSY